MLNRLLLYPGVNVLLPCEPSRNDRNQAYGLKLMGRSLIFPHVFAACSQYKIHVSETGGQRLGSQGFKFCFWVSHRVPLG